MQPTKIQTSSEGLPCTSITIGAPLTEQNPDLSHLTVEERRIIEDVMNRQREEEIQDRSHNLTVPAPVMVRRGSKVFQRVPAPNEISPQVNNARTDFVKATWAKDELFSEVTKRPKPDATIHQDQTHTRTSGDLLGVVSGFFASTGGNCCEVCRTTKFADNAGHHCSKCRRRTCIRCGGWFGPESSWFCKECFTQLSGSSPGSIRLSDSPSASTISNPSTRPIDTLSMSSHNTGPPQRNPAIVSAPQQFSLGNTAGPGYAGVANRMKLRETMRNHRSVSDEESVRSNNQPYSSSGNLNEIGPNSPPHGIRHLLRDPRQRQQQHQMHLQREKNAFKSHQQGYSQEVDDQFHGSRLRRPFSNAEGRPSSDTVGEFDSRRVSHIKGAAFSSEGSDSPRGSVGVEAFSGGSATEDQKLVSRHPTNAWMGYRNPDQGFISDPCQPEPFFRADQCSSGTTGKFHRHSCEVDHSERKRTSIWTPSREDDSLIGQVYLRRPRSSTKIGLLSSFGLKLVIGKRMPSDMVGTFVSNVREGSVANIMGGLQMGDEILEWNGHNLRGLHQAHVSEILAYSCKTDDVWLIVQRVFDDYHDESVPETPNSLARSCFDEEAASDEEGWFSSGDADPHLQLKLRYKEETQTLIVSILAARDLPPQFNKRNWVANAFCQVCILPESSQINPRCTRIIRLTNDPVWVHNFNFTEFTPEDVASRELEVAVFDYYQNRAALIGEVLIDLSVADLLGRTYWYPIPQPWETSYGEQNISNVIASEAATNDSGFKNASNPSQPRSLRAINPRSDASNLYDRRSQRETVGGRNASQENYSRSANSSKRLEVAGPDNSRVPRFTVSEDDQSMMSDNSEASEFSNFSKLSLQSSKLRLRCKAVTQQQFRHNPSNQEAGGRVHSAQQHHVLAETGEVDEDGEEEDDDEEDVSTHRSDPSRNPRSSDSASQPDESTNPKLSSTTSPPKIVSNDMTERNIKQTIQDTKITESSRKRVPSIGHKFSTVLRISKKNSTIPTTGEKKKNASFQRSEEVLPPHIMTNEKITLSGYKAPGMVAEGAGFGGIAASCVQAPRGPSVSHVPIITRQQSALAAGPNMRDRNAAEMGESHVGEFVEGLGPGQLVGRQVLGMPCLGEIQLSFFDRKGHLEVEVIRARGLQQKNTSKPLPTPYVKLHLLDGKQSVEKMRTSAPARRTLDPLFQQQFSFSTNYKEKILQVSVWGEYGRMDKKVFLGMCEIVLYDLNLHSIVFGWYKLFGMIASTAQHHGTSQQQRHNRRHSHNPDGSSASTSKRSISKHKKTVN